MDCVWSLSEWNVKMAILWRGENSCVAVNSDGGIPQHTATAVQDLTSHTLNKKQSSVKLVTDSIKFRNRLFTVLFFAPFWISPDFNTYYIYKSYGKHVTCNELSGWVDIVYHLAVIYCLRVINWIHAMHDLNTYIVNLGF